MEDRLGLDRRRHIGTQQLRENLLCRLHQTFGPARLLRFERIHFDRKFRGALDIGTIHEAPAAQLCAVGKVGVFGERVVLPAAGIFDGGAAPDSRGAVEIEERAAPRTCAVFDDEMAVEKNALNFGEERVFAVEIGPSGLHHGDSRVLEAGNGAPEKIRARNKISIENGDEFTLGGAEPFGQRASLKALAVVTVQVRNVQAQRAEALDAIARDFSCFVGGVVKNLNVEEFARVIELRNRFDQAFDDVAFVINGKLYGNLGPDFERLGRGGHIFAKLVVIVNEPITVKAVGGQNHENQEIGNHHGQIKGVGVVHALEGAVREPLPELNHRALRKSEQRESRSGEHAGFPS